MQAGTSTDSETFKAYLNGIYIRDGKATILSFDTETNAEDIRDGRGYMTSFSLGLRVGTTDYVCYFPVAQGDKPELNENWDWFKDFLNKYEGVLVMHSAKFDLEVLFASGVDYKGNYYCTMLMCHLINENYPFSKDLSSCVMHYVDPKLKKKDDQYFDWCVKQFGWANIPIDIMKAYAEHDAYVTLRLFYAIRDKFYKEVPIEYWAHKKQFMYVVRAMERAGVLIDQSMCREMIKIGEEEMESARKALKGINPGSSKDLRTLFIDQMKMPVVKWTPGNDPSFDKEAMSEYERLLENTDNPTATQVLTYRGWQKTVSSNYRSYLAKVSPDGRLRPNYKLHGTKTGRCSCSDPNLQQIPRSSEKPWNGNLKQAFVAKPGYELWEFDYSQLELRLGTAYAGISELIEVFNDPTRDIFSEMAARLGMLRQDTKTFVYSTQYGAGIDRITYALKVSRERAEEIRQNYRDTYPGFIRVSNKASNICKRTGKVELWSGRFRHFFSRKDDAHKAFNSVCQGGAADIVESIMVRLFDEFRGIPEECRLLLTVHDSVVFEIRSDCVEQHSAAIISIMSDVRPDFGVRFAVEGKRWK